MYGRGLVTTIINLGVMAILARQLTPADFGLVALAMVVLRFMTILAASGVGDYVIYDNKEGREERAQAAFWMDISLSAAIVGLGVLAIPLVTRFYKDPGLGTVLLALAFRYLLSQFSVVPDALIKKSLDFHKLVIRDTVLEIFSSLASVFMALTGWGVWSLVIPGLICAPMRAVMVWFMAAWHPKFPLRVHLWRVVFRYSINIIGTNFANSVVAEGDTLIVGKALGTAQVGLYNLAWQNANAVSRNVSTTAGKLAMPALSSVSENLERLRTNFNRMFRLIGIVSFPLLIGLFVVADLFILTIYGPQWEPSVLPLRILIVYAIRHSVGSPASVIYNVVGRPEIGLRFNLCFIPFYLISIWAGSLHGIVGVAIGVTVVRTLGGLVGFWIASFLIKERFFELLRQLFQPFCASVVMGLVVLGARTALEFTSVPQVAELFLLVGIGGCVYLLLLVTIYRALMEDLVTVVYSLSPAFATRLKRITEFTRSLKWNAVG